MKKTFQIRFTRDIQPDEREVYWPDEENAPDVWQDETEFNAEGATDEELYADLMGLFVNFVQEQKFTNIRDVEIEEVPYDGEERE